MVVRPGPDADGVRFGFRRPVGLGAVREHVDGVVVGGFLVLLVRFVLGRDDVVPVVHELHVLVHQPHIPGVHIIQNHQVPVHPENIRRRRTRLRHVHVLIISIIRAVADVLVRTRPRRMHTPAQLHRRRRHTLTIEGDRLRRRTIQRLLQQRLLRRNRHKITARTALLQLRIPRVLQLQPLTTRQKQLPRRSIQHHRLIPHHRDLQIPGTLQLTPGTRIRGHHPTIGIHRSHRHSTGLRIRAIDPVISAHRGHQTLRTHHHRLGRLLVKTIHRRRRHRPHLARRRIRHRNNIRPEAHLRRTRQLLIPTQAHIRRRNLVQRRTRLIIDKHIPRILQNVKRRTRRSHRTIKNPRRIIQPPHSILRLTEQPTHRRRSTPPQWS